jgi:hypothetical protein
MKESSIDEAPAWTLYMRHLERCAILRVPPESCDCGMLRAQAQEMDKVAALSKEHAELQQACKTAASTALRSLAGAMTKILPQEMIQEIIDRGDPLNTFFREIDQVTKKGKL